MYSLASESSRDRVVTTIPDERKNQTERHRTTLDDQERVQDEFADIYITASTYITLHGSWYEDPATATSTLI